MFRVLGFRDLGYRVKGVPLSLLDTMILGLTRSDTHNMQISRMGVPLGLFKGASEPKAATRMEISQDGVPSFKEPIRRQ